MVSSWVGLSGCDEPGSAGRDLLATLPVWTVVEELRIGREDDPDYALVPVGGMAVTPEDHVLVSQPQEGAIREFDGEGRFVRRIGRSGDGPGEFRRLGLMGVLGDTIWAVDGLQGVLEFFDLEGQWLDQREVPRIEPPYLGTARYYPLPDGGVVAPSASEGDLMLDFHEQPWFRWSPEGELIATLPGYLTPGLVLIGNQITLPGGRTVDALVPTVHPFAAASWMGIAPDQSSLVRAESILAQDGSAGALRLLRFTPDGDTLAMGQLALSPRSIPPEVADSAIEAQVERMAEPLGSEGRARRELTSRVSVPEHYPPLRSLTVGRQGRSWLALGGSAESRWLVLDADLEPLALVDIPPAFDPIVVDGGVLWGTELNELDVPQVVRYRVAR